MTDELESKAGAQEKTFENACQSFVPCKIQQKSNDTPGESRLAQPREADQRGVPNMLQAQIMGAIQGVREEIEVDH